MSELKIGIILGSTRPGRNGKAVADWVLDKAQARIGADYDLIDTKLAVVLAIALALVSPGVYR